MSRRRVENFTVASSSAALLENGGTGYQVLSAPGSSLPFMEMGGLRFAPATGASSYVTLREILPQGSANFLPR